MTDNKSQDSAPWRLREELDVAAKAELEHQRAWSRAIWGKLPPESRSAVEREFKVPAGGGDAMISGDFALISDVVEQLFPREDGIQRPPLHLEHLAAYEAEGNPIYALLAIARWPSEVLADSLRRYLQKSLCELVQYANDRPWNDAAQLSTNAVNDLVLEGLALKGRKGKDDAWADYIRRHRLRVRDAEKTEGPNRPMKEQIGRVADLVKQSDTQVLSRERYRRRKAARKTPPG